MMRRNGTPVACRAWLVTLVVLMAGSSMAQAAPDWYLLEFADGRPPCVEVAPATRCAGTQPRVARFEMRDNERIELLSGSGAPPAWTAFRGVWVYATPAVQDFRSTAIELAATPLGARLIITDRGHHTLQSLPLERWVALEGDVGSGLWVRVTPH